eukprot:7022041-Prymnesium_polylepis.1
MGHQRHWHGLFRVVRLYVYTRQTFTLRHYAPPARSQVGLLRPPSMARVDRSGIVLDPSKRSVPGFAVSGDGGVNPWALAPSHRIGGRETLEYS